MYVPEDPPANCPACGDRYDSVSRHADGFVANLIDNERYQRVCFYPVADEGDPALDCYHHTHAQAGSDSQADSDAQTDANGQTGSDAQTDTNAQTDSGGGAVDD